MRKKSEPDGRTRSLAVTPDAVGARATWRRTDMAIDLATFLLLLWPLAVNGAPFYSEDSSSYLRGGGFGYETGLLILSNAWHSLVADLPAAAAASGSPRTVVDAAIADAGGVRSVIYSVFAFLLRAPGTSLLGLAVAQAAAVTVIVSFARRLVLPRPGLWTGAAAGAGVAFLTSAGWYAAYAMPDIFAGVIVGGAMILTVFFDRLGTPARILLVLLVAFGVTLHGSHVPLALGTLAIGAAAHVWLRPAPLGGLAAPALWFAGPVLLAAIALFGSSLVAFGELSLSPKRYPIVLARSVADGPGAWYLRDSCASERYAICEVFGPNPPRDVGEFLWGAEGVRERASPEQMERIRIEEATIVRRAALAHPLAQIGASARNMAAQFGQLGLTRLNFGQTLVGTAEPILAYTHPDRPALRLVFEIVIYVVFFGSLVLLAYARRAISRTERAAIAVVLAGLLVNAAVCGILSGVTDRYQGRVAWVLPTLAIAILLRVALARRTMPAR
jgi:hypothetical protein